MNLYGIIDSYNAETLKEMMAFHGKEPLRYKRDNVRYLAEFFPQSNRVRDVLKNLEEIELIALTRLAQKNGRMSAQRLESLLNHNPPLLKNTINSNNTYYYNGGPHTLPEAKPNYKGKPSFPDLIASLTCKGLLFSEKPLNPNKTILDLVYGHIIFLPDYTLTHLKEITLPELPNPAEIAPQFTSNGSATLFIRDLSRYGRFLQNKQTLAFTTQGQLYKDDLKGIAAQMSFPTNLKSGKKEKDNGRLHFLRHLLVPVELGSQQYPTEPITTRTDASFWQQDLAQRMRTAFFAWRDKGAWYEFPQLHNYKRGNDPYNTAARSLSKSRKIVLKYMKRLGSGWMSIHELIEDIKDQDYGFLFAKRKTNRSSWYYDYRETHPYVSSNNPYHIAFDNIRSESDGWDKVEADFINHLIAGPLFWMGLVDLGYTTEPKTDLLGNQHIDGYRLTEMGLWLLGIGKKPETTTESGNLVIQPNFEILMMAPFADEALLTLDQFADVSKETEHVITYELTRLTVYRGQKQGWQAPRIAKWLDDNSSQPLPQNVQRTLDEWDALHNRIVIHSNTTLIETADSDTAQQIKDALPNGRLPHTNHPHCHNQWRKRLPPSYAKQVGCPSLPSPDKKRLPTPSNSTKTAVSPSCTPPPASTPKGLSSRSAAKRGDGRILTEAQIKAAIADGQSYEDIEEQLYSIHQGPLPKH